MRQEIIYDRASGRIIAARRIVAPRNDLQPGEGQAKLFLDFDPGNRPLNAFRVTEQGRIEAREDSSAKLLLSSDATATSPIDGIPELPADGKSLTTITVQKVSNITEQPLMGVQHNNRLNIRTSAGVLSTQQIDLDQGQGSFTLRSAVETVVAEVQVWASELPQPATIRVEFAPVVL